MPRPVSKKRPTMLMMTLKNSLFLRWPADRFWLNLIWNDAELIKVENRNFGWAGHELQEKSIWLIGLSWQISTTALEFQMSTFQIKISHDWKKKRLKCLPLEKQPLCYKIYWVTFNNRKDHLTQREMLNLQFSAWQTTAFPICIFLIFS